MSDEAIPGRGLIFRMGDGAGNFSPIAEIIDVGNLMPESLVFGDCTTQDTPEFESARKPIDVEIGEITLTGFWLPADGTHDHKTGLRYAQENRIAWPYQVKLPGDDDLRAAFTAYVKSINPNIPLKGFMGFTATFQPTGKITIEDDV